MSEPRWITAAQAVRIHAEQLAIFGGPSGLRDEGMLESALGRPQNKWAYGERDLAALAAAYAFGLARNHPFVDGNKRAALLCLIVFLRKNGVPFAPSESDATAIIQALAAGEIPEEGLARWIRDNWPEETAAGRQGKVKPAATRSRPAGDKRAKPPTRKPTPKRPGGR